MVAESAAQRELPVHALLAYVMPGLFDPLLLIGQVRLVILAEWDCALDSLAEDSTAVTQICTINGILCDKYDACRRADCFRVVLVFQSLVKLQECLD